MSRVYRALDEKFDLPVALKLSRAREDSAFRARFRREAVIGRMLGSVHVGRSIGFVQAQDWGEDQGYLYLAMDYVPQASALDVINGPLAERMGKLARVARLIQEIHSLEIVHRDLKPGNILVSRKDGRIYLADFGLAKVLNAPTGLDPLAQPSGELTQTGIAIGTPWFMAPEQFRDAASADKRADIYALGVILFQGLTGELPYTGGLTEIIRHQTRVELGQDPPPTARGKNPSVPLALDRLCSQATSLRHEDRLPTVEAFLAGLNEAGAEGSPETIVRPSTGAVARTASPGAPSDADAQAAGLRGQRGLM